MSENHRGYSGCVEAYHDGHHAQTDLNRLVSDTLLDSLADTFRALSDPTRLRLVSLLAGDELRVCDLAAALGMSQSAISHQLRTLPDLRLVRRRREGRQMFYRLDDDHVADLIRQGLEHVAHE